MSNILEGKNLDYSYGDKKILKNVTVNVEMGTIVSVLGASGVGKSTLFNVLSGLYKPTAGSIVYNGEDITGKPGKIGYMLQKDLLLPHLTIEDNVSLPLVLRKMKKAEAREKVSGLFQIFDLEGCQKMYPSQMSGGMKQRAALLRTYVASSDLVLLDEPFSALDAITTSKMHEWFKGIVAKVGLSAFIVTHDVDEAILLSDKIYILGGRPGEVVRELNIKKTDDFYLSPEFVEYKKEILGLLAI